ncbi:MAG: alanyl-tRNA synthetase, partial [Glaciecola sp.]
MKTTPLSTDAIRETFLSFYENQGHRRL